MKINIFVMVTTTVATHVATLGSGSPSEESSTWPQHGLRMASEWPQNGLIDEVRRSYLERAIHLQK